MRPRNALRASEGCALIIGPMESNSTSSTLTDRRWLIGIGITLAFGIFGVVMSILSYSDRNASPAPLAAPTVTAGPTAPAGPTPKSHGKGHGHE